MEVSRTGLWAKLDQSIQELQKKEPGLEIKDIGQKYWIQADGSLRKKNGFFRLVHWLFRRSQTEELKKIMFLCSLELLTTGNKDYTLTVEKTQGIGFLLRQIGEKVAKAAQDNPTKWEKIDKDNLASIDRKIQELVPVEHQPEDGEGVPPLPPKPPTPPPSIDDIMLNPGQYSQADLETQHDELVKRLEQMEATERSKTLGKLKNFHLSSSEATTLIENLIKDLKQPTTADVVPVFKHCSEEDFPYETMVKCFGKETQGVWKGDFFLIHMSNINFSLEKALVAAAKQEKVQALQVGTLLVTPAMLEKVLEAKPSIRLEGLALCVQRGPHDTWDSLIKKLVPQMATPLSQLLKGNFSQAEQEWKEIRNKQEHLDEVSLIEVILGDYSSFQPSVILSLLYLANSSEKVLFQVLLEGWTQKMLHNISNELDPTIENWIIALAAFSKRDATLNIWNKHPIAEKVAERFDVIGIWLLWKSIPENLRAHLPRFPLRIAKGEDVENFAQGLRGGHDEFLQDLKQMRVARWVFDGKEATYSINIEDFKTLQEKLIGSTPIEFRNVSFSNAILAECEKAGVKELSIVVDEESAEKSEWDFAQCPSLEKLSIRAEQFEPDIEESLKKLSELKEFSLHLVPGKETAMNLRYFDLLKNLLKHSKIEHVVIKADDIPSDSARPYMTLSSPTEGVPDSLKSLSLANVIVQENFPFDALFAAKNLKDIHLTLIPNDEVNHQAIIEKLDQAIEKGGDKESVRVFFRVPIFTEDGKVSSSYSKILKGNEQNATYETKEAQQQLIKTVQQRLTGSSKYLQVNEKGNISYVFNSERV